MTLSGCHTGTQCVQQASARGNSFFEDFTVGNFTGTENIRYLSDEEYGKFMKQSDEFIPTSRVAELLRQDVLAAFDRAVFERDGYWVWEGILTETGRTQWRDRLKKLQQMNDGILLETDWAAIDFTGRGLAPPSPEQITPQFLANCRGGSEQMPGFLRTAECRRYMHEHGLFGPDPALVTRGFESQGVMPEYCPGAYDDFILDVITAHPQMMELFRKLLGDRFVIDHCFMLNRAASGSGRRWHAHQYRSGQYEVEDPIGTGRAVTQEFLRRQCIRTLCYPEGASLEDGGELAVIPGAHLYRIPYKWDLVRPDDDDAMRKGWLKGKTHAVTGKPLEIAHLSLPPGSMVSFVHHMPHYVGYRQPRAPTRWGLLMAFRTPDPQATPADWSEGVPSHWVKRVEVGGKLTSQARRVFEGDVPIR